MYNSFNNGHERHLVHGVSSTICVGGFLGIAVLDSARQCYIRHCTRQSLGQFWKSDTVAFVVRATALIRAVRENALPPHGRHVEKLQELKKLSGFL